MGMYTELYLSVEFKKDIPADVVLILKHLFGDEEVTLPALPDHEFFQCDRWSMIGRCSSFYFVPFATSKLHRDDLNSQYYLTTRSDLKNYGGEIKKFLDWIMPYLDQMDGDHLGHYRYEEDDAPTLIFYPKVV